MAKATWEQSATASPTGSPRTITHEGVVGSRSGALLLGNFAASECNLGTPADSFSNTLSLLLPVLKVLPEEFFTMDPPLTMVFNTDDGPRGLVQ